jgi:hypothetical protein
MKGTCLVVLLLTTFAGQCAERLRAEAGIGWEYGVIGSQVSLQTPLEPLEIFATVGVDGSSDSGGSFRGGMGASVFLTKYFAVSAYGGMNATSNAYDGDVEHEFGGSTGIKIYLAGKNKPGVVIGASYLYDGEDWSPLASIAYRF